MFPLRLNLLVSFLNKDFILVLIRNIKEQVATFCQVKGTAVQTHFINIIHKVSIINSIKLLTIHHKGIKSALELQNQ